MKWFFILPNSPYVGGNWESAVKVFKHHYKKVVGTYLVTLEEMSTLLALIEGCLNSRLITQLINDPVGNSKTMTSTFNQIYLFILG